MMHHAARWIALVLFCGAQALAQQTDTADVTGRVTDSNGNPVGKATILLSGGFADGGRGRRIPLQPYRGVTAGDGSYSFAGIAPGQYDVQALRAGYVPGTSSDRSGVRVVAGQNVTNVNIVLRPAGSVSGRVVDENGDPVSGVTVRLWRQNKAPDGSLRFAPAGTRGLQVHDAVTNNAGQYKILNIEPGSYFLSAGGPNGGSAQRELFDIAGLRVHQNGPGFGQPARPGQRPEAYLTTWYPHAAEGNLSSPVEIASGRTVAGIDIQLQKTPLFQVRGKVSASDPGNPPGPTHIQAITSSGSFMGYSGPQNNVGSDGSFQLDGLAPDEYYLTVNGTTPANMGTLAVQKVTVRDRDVEGLVVNVQPTAEIHGNLMLDGKPPSLPDGPLMVSLVGREGPALPSTSPQSIVGADGSFTLPRVIPGAYHVKIGAQRGGMSPPGALPGSVSLNGVEVGESEFNLASGPATLQVTFVSANGVIRGSVQPDASGVIAKNVIIVPVSNTPGISWRFRQYSTNSAGQSMDPTFWIGGLPAGEYRLYAMGPVDQNSFDPGTLKQYESQSVKVTVSGSEPVFTTVRSIAPGK